MLQDKFYEPLHSVRYLATAKIIARQGWSDRFAQIFKVLVVQQTLNAVRKIYPCALNNEMRCNGRFKTFTSKALP